MDYNFREIEQKWQKRWVENGTYRVVEASAWIYRIGYLCQIQASAGLQCAEPDGLRCLRTAC